MLRLISVATSLWTVPCAGQISGTWGESIDWDIIQIRNTSIAGTLPPEFANFNLSALVLDNNRLQGPIPSGKAMLCFIECDGQQLRMQHSIKEFLSPKPSSCDLAE